MDKNIKTDGFKNEFFYVFTQDWIAAASENELFNYLLVTDIGYFPCARYPYRKRFCGCDTALLIYCREGEGVISVGDNACFTLKAGQAAFIPPNVKHSYGSSEEFPWSVYWVHFKGTVLDSYFNMLGDCTSLNIPFKDDSNIVNEFERCFDILKAPYQTEEYFLVCQSVGVILAHIAYSAKQYRRLPAHRGGQVVEKCLWHMEINVKKALTLEELAGYTGFSISYLSALFRQATGHAPLDYFIRIKIQAAAKELYFSERTAKEIAIEYGIQDPYYFSRLFKKVMGVSPSNYRKQIIG